MKTKNVSFRLRGGLLLCAGILMAFSANKAVAEPEEKAADYKRQQQGVDARDRQQQRDVDARDRQQEQSADARARMTDPEKLKFDASDTLRKSTELYQTVIKGSHGQVPDSVLSKARCVAVLPNVISGAVILGGSRGSGITSCREETKWSAPAFIKLTEVSFGAQLGGKSSDMVLFIFDEKAKTALKQGKLRLGTDASVTAGKFDRSFDASGSGIAAYTRTEGAFAGVSVSGGTISRDDSATTAFYDKDVDHVSLLEGRVTTQKNEQVDRFTSLLPR